jgi:hypothetical protein
MSTRILSFEQLCLEADPDMVRKSRTPWIYEFSNGRLFNREANPYPILAEKAIIGTLPTFRAEEESQVPYFAENVVGGTIQLWPVDSTE